MAISSPCIKVCAVDPATNICVGCGRSSDQILGWAYLTEAERLEIMEEIAYRGRPPAAGAIAMDCESCALCAGR
ncbi:DUF1289 domain-containing protein [Alsobacter soli]|uniref:DUF1289 domain-containing protein n=1 Tax=Alsobacter soli TaxID=2109933 RepID=A0A2T1HLY6_9HYPH|nr:DUF1289 domain-containing protein [Alsobacter soli]PSC02646.1 DUF1289 domain-containing protein [Alsobacter soli]